MLTGVLAAGDAEAKLKVEALQQLFAEIVPLNHPEVIDGDVPYCEFNTKTQKQGIQQRSGSSVFIYM